MELKVNREVITVCEELYSGVQEQSTELDYILPDYFSHHLHKLLLSASAYY